MQLTLPELTAARGFLGQARMLVAGVHSLFFNVGEASTAARLNDIDGIGEGFTYPKLAIGLSTTRRGPCLAAGGVAAGSGTARSFTP